MPETMSPREKVVAWRVEVFHPSGRSQSVTAVIGPRPQYDCADGYRAVIRPLIYGDTPSALASSGDHAELLAKLKTNDPTNPAHRLARDLQVNAYLGSEARDDLIEVLSDIAALRGERTFLMEQKEGADDALFDGLTRATQAERQRDELLNAWRDDGIDLEDFGRIVARLANQGAE